MTRPAILYLSYDGMLEPLGQSQVLAYLERLSGDFRIHLISFEKKADWTDFTRREATVARIRAAGISWTPLRYHKSPTAPATAFDLAVGATVALSIAFCHRIRIVHARSYIPALIGFVVKRLLGGRLLFDMRGFWPDERVDGGLWPRTGRLYRTSKSLERILLRNSDQIVTLTHASETEIRRFEYLRAAPPPMTVIPTCADLERFRLPKKRALRPFVMGYVGSIGTWYLFDEALASFRLVLEREADARLLVVNRNDQDLVRSRVRAMEIDPSRVEILAAEHAQMPALIGRMSAGIAIIKPLYSKMASAPTKLAEYLGCGVPCLGNSNIGDVEAILESNRVGVALKGFTRDEMQSAVDRLIALSREPGTPRRCRDVATALFSLEEGVDAYRAIYEFMAGRAGPGVRAR